MNIDQILLELDAEIARLQQAKALLTNTAYSSAGVIKRKPGRPPSAAKGYSTSTVVRKAARRTMSAEGRAKIAAAQKARWAKTKKAAKSATKKKPGRPAKAASKKTESAASQA